MASLVEWLADYQLSKLTLTHTEEHQKLVLSRKSDEGITIHDHIKLHVVQVSGNRVRIAIDAPAEIEVHRNEVYDAILEFRSGIDTKKSRN